MNVDLPITTYRERIIASVAEHQVTIIVAETGAGKSTQVPQYLAAAGWRKVVVTQPRVLAARSLCERVREEWPEGLVGYRTAYERNDPIDAVILYCTDGLQLVREVTGSGTSERQILVLDEIHEWNQNMEVLVAWTKRRCQEEAEFKLVIMSATVEAEALAAYFGAPPAIEVPGRTYPISMGRGRDVSEEFDTQLGHNILVFLPGKAEIERMAERLLESTARRGVTVIPLHGQLTAAEQALAFASYPGGKVVLSTNVAQTSVTIDDIDVVIDSGLERRSEIVRGVEGLVIDQASCADCLQRAGRTGRTKPGKYILAPLDQLPCLPLERRQPFAVPEIRRTHLDRLVLRLASAGIEMEALEFFHAPTNEAVVDALCILTSLGALIDGRVTPMGWAMERFPVQSRYARMLVEAAGLPDCTRAKLAAIIAIQEAGGIVRGSARTAAWQRFTLQERSDLLAQYDVYLALPNIDPKAYEDLGIVTKNVERTTETLMRLVQELAIPLQLAPVDEAEEEILARCLVAGQLDQVWLASQLGLRSLNGGGERDLSGSSVVVPAGLLAGTPFDLEVPTPHGIETLRLVQGLTAADPAWLIALAPERFSGRPGKVQFDLRHGLVVRQWWFAVDGKTLKGLTIPVHESRLFVAAYATWAHGQLENDRRQLQKQSKQRMASVPFHRVRERVEAIVHGAISLHGLTSTERLALAKLAEIRTYIPGSFKTSPTFRRKRRSQKHIV
jgi:HrpA-like RNA helicase